MKTLVTGGAGFIGSHLVRALVREQHHEVRVVDNLITGKQENLRDVQSRVDLLDGDISDLDFVRQALQGIDCVFHHAALASVPRSIENPLASNRANIEGTLNVLVAARDNHVRRVVYASSSSVYGDAEASVKSEDLPTAPLSPYALTKYTGETYCGLFHRLYGLETISLRYFNVFGPNQDPNSQYAAVIPKFICAMLKGEAPVIFGDGTQSRDFTYVANNVQANLLAARSRRAVGKVINVACGTSITLNELVQLINEELGTSIKPRYTDPRPGDVKHSRADISRAIDLLGYEPSISFREGLRETIRWYKSIRSVYGCGSVGVNAAA